MRKLNEIAGLSPYPWKLESNGVLSVDCVVDADGKLITGITSTVNGRLFQESPTLYECLLEATDITCRRCCHYNIADHKCYDGIECKKHDCVPRKWREALARAAGEQVKKEDPGK